ncbi:hypothetical protein HK102_010538, partial [Quaeritorhiza haematococci]
RAHPLYHQPPKQTLVVAVAVAADEVEAAEDPVETPNPVVSVWSVLLDDESKRCAESRFGFYPIESTTGLPSPQLRFGFIFTPMFDEEDMNSAITFVEELYAWVSPPDALRLVDVKVPT